MKFRLSRSQVIQSVVMNMMTIVVMTAEPIQNTQIRTTLCVRQNFRAEGAQSGYRLSCNIMSVTIKAVIKSPNHVPQAAAFIILKRYEIQIFPPFFLAVIKLIPWICDSQFRVDGVLFSGGKCEDENYIVGMREKVQSDNHCQELNHPRTLKKKRKAEKLLSNPGFSSATE